jgi:hypothetical protein
MTDAPSHPAMFKAPMDADRKRFLLRHLPTLADVREPTGDIKELLEEGLLAMVFGRFEVTESGKRFLEMA